MRKIIVEIEIHTDASPRDAERVVRKMIREADMFTSRRVRARTVDN